MIQVALQWTMFSIIIILFLIYFPQRSEESLHQDSLHQYTHHEYSHDHPHEHSRHDHHIPRPSEILHSEYKPPTYRTAVSVTVASAVYFILASIISIVFLNTNVHDARVWAAWLGVLSMVLAAMQYLPQLWVTWRIKVFTLNPYFLLISLTFSLAPFYSSDFFLLMLWSLPCSLRSPLL